VRKMSYVHENVSTCNKLTTHASFIRGREGDAAGSLIKTLASTMPYEISIQNSERNRNTSLDLAGKIKLKRLYVS
jgi:hypothetical protein